MATLFIESADGVGAVDGGTPTTGTTTFSTAASLTGLTFSNLQKKDGNLSFHVNTATALSPSPVMIFGSGLTQAYVRAYIYPPAAPSGSTYFMSARTFDNTKKAADLRFNADLTVTARDGIATTITSTGTALAANAWNRVEWGVKPAASGSYQYLRLFVGSNVDGLTPDFESLLGTCSSAIATDVGRFVFGLSTAAIYEYFFDIIQGDDTTWVGPVASVASFSFAHTVTVG